jgi:hypothetical protein
MRLSTVVGILIVILLMAITADYLDKIEADIQSLQADVAGLQQGQDWLGNYVRVKVAD